MKKLLHSIILITCSIYAYSQQGYTINSIKLFEQGTTQPKVADRFYSSSFYKEFTRYIAVEVNFTNHLHEKKNQKHDIEIVWYDAQGNVLGKQNGKIQIELDWTSSYYSSSGWGSKDPGKWNPGTYKVDIYIDKLKVAEKNFTIKEKEYNITSIKIFGYKNELPVKKNRDYSNTFNSDSLKFLSLEINFINLLFEKGDQEHHLMLKWYTASGGSDGIQKDSFKISSEWESPFYTSKGWGYNELGRWKEGKYQVEIYLDNNLIETHALEVKNTEQLFSETAAKGNDLNVLILHKPSEQRLYECLTESDIEPSQASKLAPLLASENTSVYKIGKSLFIGTEEQIKVGSYKVAIVSSFDPHFSDLTSITEYHNGMIKNTILGDGRRIDYKEGSLLNFTVTTTEIGQGGEPLKHFIVEYRNGNIFGSALYLTTIEGFNLQYDPRGNLRNLEQIRSGNGGSYNYMKLGNGFKIISRTNEVYFFDNNGRVILPVSETVENNTNSQTETVGFDKLQDLTIHIPEYGKSRNNTIHMHNIQKVSVIVCLNEYGELSRSNTISTGTGEMVGPQINYMGSTDAQTFRVSNYRELRSVGTYYGDSITLVMSKSGVKGAPWTGVKDNKVYTELANGRVLHTSWRETRMVKLENGVLVKMTVSRALPDEAPWYGELGGSVYTELENGTFRKIGKTKTVSHTIDGVVFNIKAYARTGINIEDDADVRWSYLLEDKIYQQDREHNTECIKEYRYYITGKGEIVTMSRELQNDKYSPWSYTTLNGDGYLQNEDGTFTKISETDYIIHEKERVEAIHDLRNSKTTISNGVFIKYGFRLQ